MGKLRPRDHARPCSFADLVINLITGTVRASPRGCTVISALSHLLLSMLFLTSLKQTVSGTPYVNSTSFKLDCVASLQNVLLHTEHCPEN